MPNKHDNGFFLYMWNWCLETNWKSNRHQKNLLYLPLFGLIQKVRKKIKTANSIPFEDLTPNGYSLLQAKGFLRILSHDAWRMSLQLCLAFASDNVPWKTSNSMSVKILSRISFVEVNSTFIFKITSRAWKDVTRTLTTKLRQNFWLFEPRYESEFQKF